MGASGRYAVNGGLSDDRFFHSAETSAFSASAFFAAFVFARIAASRAFRSASRCFAFSLAAADLDFSDLLRHHRLINR